jgi:endonuclease/exonuclease/phosphatase family metal-dependent hydrolase
VTGRALLRLMSYNVHGLRGDLTALAEVVRGARPHVVVVQEAPRRWRWRARCAELASRLGLVVAGGGEPALGNLILVNLGVRVHAEVCVRYPLTPGRHLRGAVALRCSLGRTPFAVAGSHLATYAPERPGQATEFRKLLDQSQTDGPWTDHGGPIVAALDINEDPGGPAWQILTERLVDAAASTGQGDVATFPAAAPDRRIDAILVDPRCEVTGYRVLDTVGARRASDHLPVLVEVALPG